MKDIRGLFIKLNREELGYSLEALSNGICSPSYLSKIEHDELKASEEIYILLLNKLDIEYNFNDNLKNEKEWLNKYFEYYISSDVQCKKYALKLKAKEDILDVSDLFIYFQIFKLYTNDYIEWKNVVELEHYVVYMNSKEKFLYYLYKGLLNDKDIFDVYLDENISPLIFKSKGNALLKQELYIEAYDMYSKGFQIAAQIGHTTTMSDLSIDLGYICSFFDFRAMEKYYQRAINLSQNNKTVTSLVFYNIGSIYLTDRSKWSDAYKYLSKGIQLCEDKKLLEKYNNNLFIYYCLINDSKKKQKQFNHINKDSEYYIMFSEMNKNNNYDHDILFSDELSKIYKENSDNRLLEYLYHRNCIANRKYKEVIHEDIKNKY